MIKNSFRQICDKPCANKIVKAEWSPKRDLIAVITSSGDVRLHRLYWQKVWVIPAKNVHAVCLSWNSEGTILSVGFENGDVSLYEIEKANLVHTFSGDSKVTALQWFSISKADAGWTYKDTLEQFELQIDKKELKKNLEKMNNLIARENYAILAVGASDGKVVLLVDGIFPLVTLSVSQFSNEKFQNISDVVCLNLNLKTGELFVIFLAEPDGEQIKSFYLYKYTSALMASRVGELSLLSVKYIKILNILSQCEKTLKQMADAAEDIYVKINNKLEKFEAFIQGNGSTVAEEFTIAYTTGRTSPELQTFLSQNLTTKDLKQIAQSVQAGYSSLHNAVKDELELLATQLLFLFVEMKGMSQWFEKFAILGLSLEAVQNCITLLVQFVMKEQELLKVITDDMNNFKVFFNWLASLVFDVTGEPTQFICNQISNEDFDVMLDFLEHRLNKTDTNGIIRYDLERVSQYLRAGALATACINDDNDWYNFVADHPILSKHPSIVKPGNNSTLLELFVQLKKSANIIFESICNTMTDSFAISQTINLFKQATDHSDDCSSVFSFLSDAQTLTLSVLPCTCDAESFFLLDVSNSECLKALSLSINPFSKDESLDTSLDPERFVCTLRDMKFYNEYFITVLYDEENKLEDRVATVFGKIPLQTIHIEKQVIVNSQSSVGVLDRDDISIPVLNLSNLFSEQRRLETFRGKHLVVNGYSREILCIIAMSARRVRVFDMTAEDDDGEDSKLDESSKSETTFASADSQKN